ncbi:MAG: VWA domain-containing protein [Fibrella sp.]|nr:VWA domain-containing protein [Armatimonadota bacterium]
MLSPLALLWLLPIGGAITLLYLLKQKRENVRIPSLMLWEQVLSPVASASPFQKLRTDPLLLLQLLAALLFCLALARPFIWSDSVGGRTIALVIDASASMNATDVPGGRFESAIGEARQIIEKKSPSDSIALVLAGTRPVVLSALSADKRRLLSALRKAAPSDAGNGPREALLLAGSLVASRPDARVTLITDGAFSRQDELSLGGASLSAVTVGKGSANVGITAFDVREEADAAGTQAFVTVQNADAKPHTVPLALRSGDKLIEAREIKLPAGETRSLVIPLANTDIPPTADFLSARIESGDELLADNEASAALPSRRAIRVLLVAGNDDPFLERALSLAPRVTVQRVSPSAFAPKSVSTHDLVVWNSENTPPAKLPAGRYLFFGAIPTGDIAPVTSGGANIESPPILDWDRASPLLRFTDLSGVRVRLARKVTPAPWASVVVESKTAPLVVLGERSGSGVAGRGETRVAYVAFRPTQSDFPLRVAFPVFISNAVAYLAGRTDADQARVLRPGDTVPIPAGGSITRSDGKSESVSGGTFSATDRVGIYTITPPNGAKSRFAVSLLSAGETQIAPDTSPQITVTDIAKEGTDPTKPRKSPQEGWVYFAAPLLILLAFEWWLFHRRKR